MTMKFISPSETHGPINLTIGHGQKRRRREALLFPWIYGLGKKKQSSSSSSILSESVVRGAPNWSQLRCWSFGSEVINLLVGLFLWPGVNYDVWTAVSPCNSPIFQTWLFPLQMRWEDRKRERPVFSPSFPSSGCCCLPGSNLKIST